MTALEEFETLAGQVRPLPPAAGALRWRGQKVKSTLTEPSTAPSEM